MAGAADGVIETLNKSIKGIKAVVGDLQATLDEFNGKDKSLREERDRIQKTALKLKVHLKSKKAAFDKSGEKKGSELDIVKKSILR